MSMLLASTWTQNITQSLKNSFQRDSAKRREAGGTREYYLGPSTYDVRKIFRFFDPLPPCPHLELICSIKFTQPLLLRPLFHDPPPMGTSYLDAPSPQP